MENTLNDEGKTTAREDPFFEKTEEDLKLEEEI